MPSSIVHIIIIIFLCSQLSYADTSDHTVSSNVLANQVMITITPGMSSHAIARVLHAHDVIRSERAFAVLARLKGVATQLPAGTYLFSKHISANNALNMFIHNASAAVKVTIPEGFTDTQIAERLSAKGLGSRSVFERLIHTNKLQGYLYPETYFFSPTLNEQEILAQMVAQFHTAMDPVFAEVNWNSFAHRGYRFGQREAVILASLVEREAQMDSERPRIAAVFHNRLKKGMRLESCASVEYVIGTTKAKLTYQDLAIDSPYNTYRHSGLPPSPICSPGKQSLSAALFPMDTHDLFFVKDPAHSGAHIFSATYNGHLSVQRKYRVSQ